MIASGSPVSAARNRLGPSATAALSVQNARDRPAHCGRQGSDDPRQFSWADP